MKIVNEMTYSTKNVNAIGVALGIVFISAGAAALKIGIQSVAYGVGFRGKFAVYK